MLKYGQRCIKTDTLLGFCLRKRAHIYVHTVIRATILGTLCNHYDTGGPRYMQTFYVRFRVYAIKIMAFQRNVSSNLPMLLVSLYASQFFRSLSIAYNEGRLYSQYTLMFYLQCQRVRGPEAGCEKSCEPFGGKKS